ncbi:hypothetical protein Q0590_09490 [Rhodocytophaga aerolata]|uniref:Alpha-1,2-fucosyltransferase n=1 Tax=Rhodocytophaga aerolata TaxID=455078 RepID=A0ABT8R301_9BACT|nr:hypothetical protein [Rhodocytophaga aerolata]MDO1446481.1 hypothetical protein [Rhodocytophaga aerolata]
MNLPVNKNKIVLLHWNGRFGNRLFTYAFLRHYADEFNLEIWLPSSWEGDILFENTVHKCIEDDELRLYLNQTMKELDTLDARLEAINRYNLKTGDAIQYMNPDIEAEYGRVNICIDSLCCYQSYIFTKYSKAKMLTDYFRFSEKVLNSDLYRRMEDKQGTYHVAHLRRDDIANRANVTNQGYSVISKKSYEKAFVQYGYDPKTIEWVTDDRTGNWGIPPLSFADDWSYPEGSVFRKDIFFTWLPDFLKLKFAKTIFRANSSFSWWAAFLSNAAIYSPRLHTRELFHQTGKELEVEFEEGNHPHWMCVKGVDHCDDIHIPA